MYQDVTIKIYDDDNLTMMAYLYRYKFGNFEFLCEFQVLH